MGVGRFHGPGVHLCDDLVIVEPVDLDGRPVPPGVRSDKLYLTALANPTLPLIRFELTDQVRFLDIPCLRLRPPVGRRRGGTPGRRLHLPGGLVAPARLRLGAPPRPGDRRVPGPPDPVRAEIQVVGATGRPGRPGGRGRAGQPRPGRCVGPGPSRRPARTPGHGQGPPVPPAEGVRGRQPAGLRWRAHQSSTASNRATRWLGRPSGSARCGPRRGTAAARRRPCAS